MVGSIINTGKRLGFGRGNSPPLEAYKTRH